MKHLAIILLLALAAAAAPTQIRDTAYTGFTGVLFTGRITITGSEMTTRDGRTIHRWEQSLTISNIVVSLDLEPNEGASPPGTSYLVVYRPTSGQSWSERWVVPISATPVTVDQGSLVLGQSAARNTCTFSIGRMSATTSRTTRSGSPIVSRC